MHQSLSNFILKLSFNFFFSDFSPDGEQSYETSVFQKSLLHWDKNIILQHDISPKTDLAVFYK